jgi:hypothetical protein
MRTLLSLTAILEFVTGLYNIGVAVVFIYAGVGLALSGIGRWPAAGGHLVMAIWCVLMYRKFQPEND